MSPWSRRTLHNSLILVAAVLGLVMMAGCFFRPPAATPTSGFHPQSCGDTKLDSVTLVYSAKKHATLNVATFYPWGCPDEAKISKSGACHFGGQNLAYPDFTCTPGAIYDLTGNTNPAKYNEAANTKILCSTTTPGIRNVTAAMHRAIFNEYGVRVHTGATYEDDHVVSLVVGGSNHNANRAAEPISPDKSRPLEKPGFRQKDVVESYEGRSVCGDVRGEAATPLHVAQDILMHSWLSEFHKLKPQSP